MRLDLRGVDRGERRTVAPGLAFAGAESIPSSAEAVETAAVSPRGVLAS